MTPEEIRAGIGDALVVAVSDAYGLTTVDVAPADWVAALTAARDVLGCSFFDWLSGVDELAEGFDVVAHVCAIPRGPRLLIRTRVPRESPTLATATGVYAGAAWHERETHEMFGVDFAGHPGLAPLLLPDGFEGHPLRKEFVLAARVAKAWPGAKEPGESDHGPVAPGRSPGRRRTLPPGVPDPATWGPNKQAAGAESEAASEERRPRRTRGVSQGPATPEADPTATPRPARRARSVSEGSASQATPPAGPPPASTEPSEPEPRAAEAPEPEASEPEPRATEPPESHPRAAEPPPPGEEGDTP